MTYSVLTCPVTSCPLQLPIFSLLRCIIYIHPIPQNAPTHPSLLASHILSVTLVSLSLLPLSPPPTITSSSFNSVMAKFFRKAGLTQKKAQACAEESICLDANSPRKLNKYVHEVNDFNLMNLGKLLLSITVCNVCVCVE